MRARSLFGLCLASRVASKITRDHCNFPNLHHSSLDSTTFLFPEQTHVSPRNGTCVSAGSSLERCKFLLDPQNVAAVFAWNEINLISVQSRRGFLFTCTFLQDEHTNPGFTPLRRLPLTSPNVHLRFLQTSCHWDGSGWQRTALKLEAADLTGQTVVVTGANVSLTVSLL